MLREALPTLLALQESSGVSVPSSSPGQVLIALFLIGVLIAVLVVVRQQASNLGLPDENREHRSTIRAQLHGQTPGLLQLRSRRVQAGVDDLTEQVDALFERTDDESQTASGHVGMRGATREAYSALSGAWGHRVGGVPTAVLSALQWAVLVAVFGSVAVSTGAVVAWLSHDPNYPTLAEFLTQVGTEAGAAAGAGVNLVGQFPFAGLLFTLAYAYAFLAALWLYAHWYVLVGLLLVSAVVVWWLDYRLDTAGVEPPRRVVGHPWLAIASAVGIVLVTWATGTAFALLGSLVGGVFATVFDIVGFLAALVVFLFLGGKGARAGLRRIRRGLRVYDDEHAGLVEASLLIHRLIRVSGGVAALLVLGYLIVATTDGSFATIARAFANASPDVQLAVGLALVLFIGAIGWVLREAWPDVHAALTPAFAQRTVRTKAVVTGLPLLGVAAGYLVVWTFTQRIVTALVAAVVIGLVLRSGGRAFSYAMVASDWREILQSVFRSPEPRWVTWEAFVLLDADGRHHYLVNVCDERIASTSRSDAVRAAVQVGREVATGESVTPTLAGVFAADLVERGITDPDETRSKQGEKVRKMAFGVLRSYGPAVERDLWDRKLAGYPIDIREERLRALRPYIRVTDERVVLRRDPFADRGRSTEFPSLND